MLRRLFTAFSAIAIPGLAAAAPISVVLLGDSITSGVMSEPSGPSYAELLADSLGTGFEIASIGCGGASSRDWTNSVGALHCGEAFALPNVYTVHALPALPADLVTILLGTNDAMGFFEPDVVQPDAYAAAIGELVGDLLRDGANSVMLMTPPPNFAFLFAQPWLGDYRDRILTLCGAPGDAVLCGPDVYSLLGPEDFEPYNLHPNALGHAKVAAALHDAILGAVPEPGSAALVATGLVALGSRRRKRAIPNAG